MGCLVEFCIKIRKVVLYLCLACCIAALSGCVYLRLNQVKRQLAQFDEYFELVENDDFYLIFKKPVLYSRDIAWMMKSVPSSQEKQDQNLTYNYILEKQYSSEKDKTGNYDLTIKFIFTDDRLSKVMLEKRIFVIFPKTFFIELLRTLGGATVDKRQRKVSWQFEHKLEKEPHIPDINEVQRLLGSPYSQKDNIYTYKYLPKKPPSADNEQEKYYIADFTFDKESGKMLKGSSDLYGSKIELSFVAIPANEPKSPTSSEDTNDTQLVGPES